MVTIRRIIIYALIATWPQKGLILWPSGGKTAVRPEKGAILWPSGGKTAVRPEKGAIIWPSGGKVADLLMRIENLYVTTVTISYTDSYTWKMLTIMCRYTDT